MRAVRVGLCGLVVLAAVAAPALAGPSTYAAFMAPYVKALGRQCPEKRLDQLSPADLRDVLDDLKETLPAARRRRLDAAEAKGCADSIAGAACPNHQDIALIKRWRLTATLARRVCAAYTACRGPSDCR